jgi:hypothetical protein
MMCRPAAGYYINVYNPPEKKTKLNRNEKTWTYGWIRDDE